MTPLSTLNVAQRLLYLQDLDLLLKDAQDDGTRELWHKAGLHVSGFAQLQQMRAEVASSIAPRILDLYERIFRRYGRALVPVREGTCLGCFVKLPSGVTSPSVASDEISACQSCGRILYWI
jgi:hypothetical protein